MKDELTRVRAWAQSKIDAGSEPPWAWYQYMKLIETIDALLAGMASTVTTGSSQQSAPPAEKYLRLVDAKRSQETAPHHPVGLPVRLPT
jgi:hypothetical protein